MKAWIGAVARRLLAYSLTAYLTAGAFVYFRQGALIFPAPKAWARVSPASYGLTFEDLQIPVRSNEYVHGWWIPSRKSTPKAILVLHGNAYVMEDMGEEVSALHQIGADLLIIDYRGYGLSTAISPDEKSTTEDAEAAFVYLMQRRNISAANLFALGSSIGSGPATELAFRHKGLGGLILESPMTSIEAVSAQHWVFRLYPLKVLLRSRFDNLSKIRSIESPLLVVVGTSDTLTPVAMAEAIFANARGPKALYLVRDAGHDDVMSFSNTSLTGILRKFVFTVQPCRANLRRSIR